MNKNASMRKRWVLGTLVSLGLVACQSTPAPDVVTKSFFEALRKNDSATFKSLVANPESATFQSLLGGANPELAKALLGGLNAKVSATTVNGDDATVSAEITNTNVGAVTGEVIQSLVPQLTEAALGQNGSKPDMDALVREALLKRLAEPNLPTTTVPASIALRKTQNGWKLNLDDALVAALTGNLENAMSSAAAQMANGQTGIADPANGATASTAPEATNAATAPNNTNAEASTPAAPTTGTPTTAPDATSTPQTDSLPALPSSDAEVTQLLVQDRVVGTGDQASAGQVVTVHYTGTLLGGNKFDSSLDRGEPFSFPLGAGQVIKGWDDGVQGMRVGGKRRLVIPANLAYGASSPSPEIPANSALVFEIELLGVQKPTGGP